MDFDEYAKTGHIRYAELARTVASILKAAVKADPNLRLQHVQHRAKDPERLKTKLAKRSVAESDNMETAVKDLAGCRVVFYTNSHVSMFLNSGIVRENFDVDWERTKIHHPKPDADNPTELFISNNYVVKLKEARAALPEYADLRDMWCEVQVQTSLNHAWSEMTHDTIYKKPELHGFGGQLMQGIEERMQTIMRKHLLPAGYEFQKVQNDFERLASGKELFDQGALTALSDCDDNNARYDLLERFSSYVLPNYDDIQAVYPDIRAAVIKAVQDARETPVRPIETPFGDLPGKTPQDVAKVAADILERLRYVDVVATFDTLCELYPGAQNQEEQKRWLLVAERLAHHQLQVWKQAGPIVQSLLIERIDDLTGTDIETFEPIIIEILGQVLEPEISGTTSTFNTITFHQGAVVASQMLARVRSDTIRILQELFRAADDDASRRIVIQTLNTAMRRPHASNYSDELIERVLLDTLAIVRFYTDVAPTLSYELRQTLEHDLLWLYRHNRENGNQLSPAAEEARESLVKAILSFRDLINSDPSFVVYKTLVGFESVFPMAWDRESFDFDGERSYREQRIDEFVEEVSPDTAEKWFSVIQRCARTESNDGATFPSFGQFIEKLGKSKPDIMIGYLDKVDGRLARFLPWMLSGIEKSACGAEALARVRLWIEKKAHLMQMIQYLRFANEFDAVLLKDATKLAIEAGDDDAVLMAAAAANERDRDLNEGLADHVFLPALNYLASKENYLWVNALWPVRGESSILNSSQADAVLTALVSKPEIDYQTEEIITAIAESHATKVIDFFAQRLASKQESELNRRYDAIPYKFRMLQAPLAKFPDYLLAAAKSWFEQDKSLFAYRGGRLLANVFPRWSSEFEQSLLRVVHGGDRLGLEFVTSILRAYEGEIFLHNLCKEIVNALPPDDRLLTEIEIVLESTGVVTGEFGRVTALEQKKAEVESWLTDDRDRVRAFAERYRRDLDNQIAGEQRRSEEMLELRKREYGESDQDTAEV